MHHKSLTLSAIALIASLIGQSAHAERLATWSFTGTVGDVTKGYAEDLAREALAAVDDSVSFTPLYSAEERAAADTLLAPFATGQHFTANLVVDLDSPHSGTDGVASFPGSIKSYELLVPEAGISSINTSSTNQGISITAMNPDTNVGDVVYFYLPRGSYTNPDGTKSTATYFGGAIYFMDPTGLLHQSPDLHALADSFDPAKYNGIVGGTSLNNIACGLNTCGGFGFQIQSANLTISAVPEPSTWLTMALGLAGIGALTARRRV